MRLAATAAMRDRMAPGRGGVFKGDSIRYQENIKGRMSSGFKQLYEFGPYRVDVGLSRVERAGHPVPVPPKAFDLLLLLARNPERLLTKHELMEALWPETFVEDANLTQHVYTLRKALGDRPDGTPYIETVPRRGYRLNADVRQAAADHAVSAPSPAPVVTFTESRATPSVVLDAEHKQATVLHCAIANAAALAERLGSAGLDRAMTRLAEIAGEAVGRYEGILRRRQTDEFVALFGARIVHEDDARRAVLAALAIEKRLRESASDDGDEVHLHIRIGVSSGPVVVSRRTDDRGVEYSAVGETMRVADLLQQIAEPGAIVISDATRRAVEGYVRVNPLPVDARAAGVAAFHVVGLAPDASMRAPRPKRTLSEFVGRRQEMAALASAASLALGGRGQVVGVVGEPGMGKSRLVHEFTQTISSDVAVLEGRCVSYGSLVPYLPLVDLVRASCGVSETDTSEDIGHAIARVVHNLDLSADAGTWLLRLIGMVDNTMALEGLSAEAVKARTFDVLRTLFLKAAVRQPLVVVVEDVHWIDRTSEEFLTTLVERLMAARVMLVATHRPGYRAPWMDRSYATQITLAPLTATDSLRLVESIDIEHPLTQDVAAAIFAKAEGNPFFLEELARAVSEHGPETETIPNTVQGVIMARLDRLPDRAKRLLQTASVVGREVPLSLLRLLWDRHDDFEPELIEASRLEFLYERPGGDDTAYVFKHALTQNVAYDSLLARDRGDLHLRAARALRELHAERLDEIAATLAYHYARTDLVEEAVTWLIRAADQAAHVYANAEAILHLDLARRRLDRLHDGPTRDRLTVDVALRHAHSLYFLGRFKESVAVLQPHAARVARLSDAALTAAFTFWQAHMYSRLGDQRRAAESAQRAIEAATLAGDDATLGKAHGVLALEGHWSGNTVDGVAHGEKAVCLLRSKAEERWWLGMAYFYVAMNHLLAGSFDAALAEAARADAVGKEIGDPRLQTYAGFTAAWVEASRGTHELAIAICRRSREQAPDRVSRAYASMILGYAQLEAGDHRSAHDLLEPLVAELEWFGFPQWHAWSSILTGETYRRDGDVDTAAAFVQRGLDIATGARYWYAVGFAERISARMARDQGRPSESAEAFARALQTFERIGARFEAERTRVEAAEGKSVL
jgi:DNA-binding winged helix-turn-helix (wHTH) protein/tetratricopeptide (TPR) repeat protein